MDNICDIAVLIPCYNEASSIAKVIDDIKKEIPDSSIYVYDNNSTDGTDEIARKCGAIVRYEYKQGKGNVIRRMFREIDARCYLLIDGDNTYSVKSAKKMCDIVLEKNADMVVGDRLSSTYFVENKRMFHNVGNKFVRTCIKTLFKNDIKDIMTGYRAMNYEFVKTFPVLSMGFEIETEMSIHAIDKNMQIENVVVDYKDRDENSESKLNTYSDGWKILKMIISLYQNYRPFHFYGYIAMGLLILAAAFFVPVMITYVETGLVPDFPTLIVCGFTVIAAIQSFFSGLILHNMIQKNRQDFEIQFVRANSEKRAKIQRVRDEK